MCYQSNTSQHKDLGEKLKWMQKSAGFMLTLKSPCPVPVLDKEETRINVAVMGRKKKEKRRRKRMERRRKGEEEK